jgi:hypothetical protein
MQIKTLLVFFISLQVTTFAQKINYSIPKGYETVINSDDYKKIVDLALPVVIKRYQVDSISAGTIFLKKGQDMQLFNLHNLITKCISVNDRAQWQKIVQGHFENLFSSLDEQKKIDPANYETIKNYLSLRIYPIPIIEQRGGKESLIVKTDLEGTYTILMLDLPGAFMPVDKQAYFLWKKDSSEVFKLAQQNINKQEMEKVTKTFDIDGANVEISFIGNEDYAASYALDLVTNSPDLVGDWGSVVAIPNKGIVDICKISKDKPVDFVKFIQRLKPRVEKSYREHEQPISDQFFWYYKGKFTRIMVVTQPNGNINVISPAGLTELMTVKK